MNEFTEIFWILTVKNNQNMRFFQKLNVTKELDLKKNKEIINKLEKQDVRRIKFLGNEAFDYTNFIELLKYAVGKGIKCELLFYNLFDTKNEIFKESLKYIDSITLSIDSMNDRINTKLGKEKSYFKKINKITNELSKIDIKININTMTYSLNFDEAEDLGNLFVARQINIWRIFNFAPIFISNNTNIEKLKLSKENYHHFASCTHSFCYGIKFYKNVSDRVIENFFITITPDGNAVMIFNNELYNVGSTLKNTIDDMIKQFEKQKQDLKKEMAQEKITIFLGLDDDEMEQEIRKQLRRLKYVEIIGTAKNGVDTYKKILRLKPDMVFFKYGFEDMKGYDIVMGIADKLELDTPIFNFLTEPDGVSDYELMQMIKRTHKINGWISKDFYKNQFYEIVKGYKELMEL